MEWLQYKPLILNLASSKSALESILSTLTDDLDEGKKLLYLAYGGVESCIITAIVCIMIQRMKLEKYTLCFFVNNINTEKQYLVS